METVLVTGANSGLGFEVSKQLAAAGFRVVLVCRSAKKAQESKDKILELHPESNLATAAVELSSLDSVKSCIAELDTPIHYVICNAGISSTREPEVSKDGVELIFGVNHLAHYAFTVGIYNKFSETLKNVVVVSSGVHDPATTKGYFPEPAFTEAKEFAYPTNVDPSWKTEADRRYVHSKLCNLLFVYRLASKLEKASSLVKINAFNPGFMIGTNLARDQSSLVRLLVKYVIPLMKPFIKEMRSVQESGSDLMNLCLEPASSGKYYDGKETVESSKLSHDEAVMDDLWGLSEELTGVTMKA